MEKPHSHRELPALPTEIFLEIFEQVLSWDATPTQRDDIRLVCKRWNAFFVDGRNPTLWGDVTICVPHTFDLIRSCIRFCHKCMELSGTQPLRIALEVPAVPLNVDQDDGWYIRILEDLLLALRGVNESNLARWETFTLTGQANALLVKTFWRHFAGLSAVRLESFSIDTNQTYLSDDPEAPFQMPRVSHLSLRQCVYPYRGIDGPRLKQLELISCNNEAFRLVFDCPNLTTFCLEDTMVVGSWKLPPKSSGYFPKLLSLGISGPVPSDFWRNGTFPVLETIRFKPRRHSTDRAWSSLTMISFSSMPDSTFPELRTVFIDVSLHSALNQPWRPWNRRGVSLIVEQTEIPLS